MPSTYQLWCILWHLDRGDTTAAQLVASLPPECFAEFDRMLEQAFALGVAMKGQSTGPNLEIKPSTKGGESC